MTSPRLPGFTLLELLVVLAMITTLSLLAAVAFQQVRATARQAIAEKNLVTIDDAIEHLNLDTGKLPFGCPHQVWGSGLPYNVLAAPLSGLAAVPTAGSVGTPGGCTWTTNNVAAWNGPYIDTSSIGTLYFTRSCGQVKTVHYQSQGCSTLVAQLSSFVPGVAGQDGACLIDVGPDSALSCDDTVRILETY